MAACKPGVAVRSVAQEQNAVAETEAVAVQRSKHSHTFT